MPSSNHTNKQAPEKCETLYISAQINGRCANFTRGRLMHPDGRATGRKVISLLSRPPQPVTISTLCEDARHNTMLRANW